jgi:2-dehydro-3-deoxygalactonokinase
VVGSPRGFVSCDWGTTSLRLRWVDAQLERVSEEVASQEGVRYAFDRANSRGGSRVEAYYDILSAHLGRLEERIGHSLKDALVIASGMASSSLGIAELPYASVPFSLTNDGPVHRVLDEPLSGGQRLVLLSGVRAEDDVMRGEETQLAGLHLRLGPGDGPTVYLLPGTHSKHAVVQGTTLVSFRTFLTGELFEAVTAHTILRESVRHPHPHTFSLEAFQDGVRAAAEQPLLHALFLGRSNTLFARLDPLENYWFLSGVLIGGELLALKNTEYRIRLCAGGPLRPLYEAAAGVLGLSQRTECVPTALVEESAAWGQLAFFRRMEGRPG